MITIVNYGSGNIGAITNLLHLSNLAHEVIEEPQQLAKAQHILLPGVGSFDPTMDLFRKSGLEDAMRERVAAGAALMGICVGMQVLADSSEEGSAAGLGFIPGRVRRFDAQTIRDASKVPHMGWNAVNPVKPDHPMLKNIDIARGFYFLHSYTFHCASPDDVIGETTHGAPFHCMVGRGRVIGLQFHPEKSHQNGVQTFKNFMDI